MRKEELKETNRRLRKKKFKRSRAGYVTPGCSDDEIEKAVKLSMLAAKDKSIKIPPAPTMAIQPLTPEGGINVRFTQPTVAPTKDHSLVPKIYNNMLDISIESLNDGSVFQGDFTKSKKMRRLQSAEIDGQASKMGFTPKIERHNSTGYGVKVEFDNPTELSVGGKAAIKVGVKETSVFKSL